MDANGRKASSNKLLRMQETQETNERNDSTMRFRKSDDWIAPAANELFSFPICDNMRAFNFMAEQLLDLATESEVENEI